MKTLTLTKEFQDQIKLLQESKQTAFDMLLQVYTEKGEYSSNDIVNRIQAQQFIVEPFFDNLLGEFGWSNKEYYEPNSINNGVAPILPNKFSSFAAIHNNYEEINMPIVDSFIVDHSSFDDLSFADFELSKYQTKLKDKYDIKIINNGILSKFAFKKETLKNGLNLLKNKIVGVFLNKEPSPVMSGTITMQDVAGSRVLSNVDKLTKINDYVLKNIIDKHSSNVGNKKDSLKFASRVFAHILLSRALNLGDIKNNQELEKCMWLQFSSVLNKYNFNSTELQMITKLGMASAIEMCKIYDISYKKVVYKSLNLGFKYSKTPTNYEEAFCVISKEHIIFNNIQTENDNIRLNFSFDAANEKNTNHSDLSQSNKSEELKNSANEKDEKINQNKKEENNNSKEITSGVLLKKSTITKMIDKVVVKFLSDKATNLAENINKRKIKNDKYNNLLFELNIYNLVLSYYIKTTNTKNKIFDNTKDYSKSEISRAKIISQLLVEARNKFTDFAIINEKQNIEQDNTSFINSLSRKQFGGTVREVFINMIKFYVTLCTSKEFEQSYEQKSEEEQKRYALSQGLKYLETKKDNNFKDENELYNENYDEDNEVKDTIKNEQGQIMGEGFVMIDKDKKQAETYTPNFVIVDNQKTPHEELTK